MTVPGRWFEFKGAVFVPNELDPPLEWLAFIDWLASRPKGCAIAGFSLIELKPT